MRGAIIRSPVNHSKPLSREEIADFVRRLDSYGGNRTTAIALRLLLLTFVRTVEMRKAEWSEFNFDQPEWRIPAAKMKMRRIHIVPLARSTVDLLLELRQITGAGRWLFPNTRRPHDVMSATTVNRVLEYMGYASGAVTGHDFRATASTRLHEMGFRSEFIELQLAHVERNRVKTAYNHADYLPERRQMVQAWADWLDGIAAADKGSVR
ncbi:MAG TPA: site-specific integrase [Rhodocyclaceae bacterium]|nr:site-specific integrase [Rhodocyclaceae bacterium]